jgi:hypothetical protein
MCNHDMVTSFDGQEYCVTCNEELSLETRIDEDDDSSEVSMRIHDMLEREETRYANYMSEGY